MFSYLIYLIAALYSEKKSSQLPVLGYQSDEHAINLLTDDIEKRRQKVDFPSRKQFQVQSCTSFPSCSPVHCSPFIFTAGKR